MLQLHKYLVKHPPQKDTKQKIKDNNNKHKKRKTGKHNLKKHNSNNSKYTNLRTITSKLFFLAYFTQKILSGYPSDDIYKQLLGIIIKWCHMINIKTQSLLCILYLKSVHKVVYNKKLINIDWLMLHSFQEMRFLKS